MRKPSLVIFGAFVIAGCAAADASNGEQNDYAATSAKPTASLENVCEKQTHVTNADGDVVERCDRPFAEAPFVRLPADEIVEGGLSTLYMTYGYRRVLVDRNGVEYAMTDENGTAYAGPASEREAHLPKSLRLPSNRNLYSVYRVRGRIGKVQGKYDNEPKPAIWVESGAPVVTIPGKVIDGNYLGVWEGDASRRTGERKFDPNDRVPLRIRFTKLEANGVLPLWDSPTEELSEGELYKLVGTIENFDRPVKGSDGKCYPALTALGENNPFHGARSGMVVIYRHPHMHKSGDQVSVVKIPEGSTDWSPEGMSMLQMFSPAGFVSPKAIEPIEYGPHGMPMGNDLRIEPMAYAGETEDC